MNLNRARELYPEAVQLSALASSRFSESYNTDTKCAELMRIEGKTGEAMPIAALLDDCSYDDRRLLVKAPEIIAALLLLCQTAFEKIRQLEANQQPKKGKDYAAEAHRKCNEHQAFRRFLIERHDLPHDADANRAKIRLRSLLQVQSLKELNENPQAAERWKSLRSSFNTWMRSGKQ